MKTVIITLILIAFTLVLYSQNKPKAEYKVGKIVVKVWHNEKEGKYGSYIEKNFKVEKLYKKDDKWESTNYYSLEELLKLRAAIDKAINEESVEVKKKKTD